MSVTELMAELTQPQKPIDIFENELCVVHNPCRAGNGGLPPTEMEETSGYSKEAEKLAILEVS
jgi:hypothetical protein